MESPFRDPSVAKQVLNLLQEFEKLVEENYLKPVSKNEAVFERLKAIRKELNAMGLLLEYSVSVTLDPVKGAVAKAETGVRVPKEDMTLEEKAIYDAWYACVNNLPKI